MTTGREEWSSAEHVARYLAIRESLGRRAEGDEVLDGLVPGDARRILDLGTGDGHLVDLLRIRRPNATFVALDASPPMLEAAARRFSSDAPVELVAHDMVVPLPQMGHFDAVVSAFAIHHLEDDRKRELLDEVVALLVPGGVYANLEHVSSPTPGLHIEFLAEIGLGPDGGDASNRCIDVETQLGWMRGTGLVDVDCLWKWREMALLVGRRPHRLDESATDEPGRTSG
jgi:tRNA (cmo5U34)-methyltransferase